MSLYGSGLASAFPGSAGGLAPEPAAAIMRPAQGVSQKVHLNAAPKTLPVQGAYPGSGRLRKCVYLQGICAARGSAMT